MDAREWLGLQPTHNPMRWYLPVVPALSVRSRFLFGGAALGAAVAALEATTERPVVWATAQYLSFAPVGSVMDLDVTVSVAGHRTTQARVIGHVGETEIVTVNAALGRRDLPLERSWPVMPAVEPPERCEPREIDLEAESLGRHHPQRWAVAPPGTHDTTVTTGDAVPSNDAGPTGHGPGRVCVWTRPPDDVEPSAATLAILGDWVPMGLSSLTGWLINSTSLDNTIRVLRVVASEWYLLEIEGAGVNHGFGHGQLRIWSADGTLTAIASQSVLVREKTDR